jgi:hypothetical protein
MGNTRVGALNVKKGQEEQLKTRRALAAPNTTSGIFFSLNPFAIQESWRNIAGLVYKERNLLFQQEDIHSGIDIVIDIDSKNTLSRLVQHENGRGK